LDLFAFLYKISIWAIPVLFAITLHEVAHGWMARYFGDRTAEMLGRLSLNPLRTSIQSYRAGSRPVARHRRPLFGWAKPVPVATSVLRNPRARWLWWRLPPGGEYLMAAVWCAVLGQSSGSKATRPWTLDYAHGAGGYPEQRGSCGIQSIAHSSARRRTGAERVAAASLERTPG